MNIKEKIKKKLPFSIKGINFSFSTYRQLWVSTKDSEIFKLDATIPKGNVTVQRDYDKGEVRVNFKKRHSF